MKWNGSKKKKNTKYTANEWMEMSPRKYCLKLFGIHTTSCTVLSKFISERKEREKAKYMYKYKSDIDSSILRFTHMVAME